jgi:hypothetical protein
MWLSVGGDGDEVESDGEGELLREGEGVGVGVAGDGEEVGGVGVCGGMDQSRGERQEGQQSFAHGGVPFSSSGEYRVQLVLVGVKLIVMQLRGTVFECRSCDGDSASEVQVDPTTLDLP